MAPCRAYPGRLDGKLAFIAALSQLEQIPLIVMHIQHEQNNLRILLR
jgi:hypothetical protein